MSYDQDRATDELLSALQFELLQAPQALRDTLTPERREVLARALTDLARISAGPSTTEREADLTHVQATLLNFGAVAAISVLRASGRVVERVGIVLARIGRGLLLGLIAGAPGA